MKRRSTHTWTNRRSITAAALSLAFLVGTLGATLAHADPPGQTYTGCLQLGLIFNVRIGTSPALPCPRNATVISWNQVGAAGQNGAPGAPGQSAYQVWLGLGNSGTPQDFIDSLRGPAGAEGADGNLALAGQSCPQGEFVTGFDQSGDLICGGEAPPPPPPEVGEDCQPLNLVPGANLHHCDLSGADLSDLDLSGANLSSANLANADMSNANLTGAQLDFADLSNVDLVDATMSGANLTNSDLTNADLSNATLINASLSGANLTNATLTNADLTNAALTAANLTGAMLGGANLTDANMSHATLTDANLIGAALFGADLFGVFWANTTCPDGTNSNSNGFTCDGHRF
jgi:uncharacterized protein YjbI with pentapeptide repeats